MTCLDNLRARLLPAAFWALVAVCVAGVGELGAAESDVVTEIRALNELTQAEADLGRPARVEGVVVLRMSNRNLLFVQGKERQIAVVFAPPYEAPVAPGARVRIEGATVSLPRPALMARRLTILDAAAGVPEPESVGLAEIQQDRSAIRWVEAQCEVHFVAEAPWSAWIELRDKEARFAAHLNAVIPIAKKRLEYAHVSVRGLAVDLSLTGLAEQGRVLWIDGVSDLVIRAETPEDEFAQAARPVAELLAADPNHSRSGRVKVTGIVRSLLDSGDFQVTDGTNAIYVIPRVKRPGAAQLNDRLEAVGYVERGAGGNYLGWASFRKLAPMLRASESSQLGSPRDLIPVISTIDSVRGLSPSAAAQGHPVRLKGTVTHFSDRLLFVQDGTGGIRVMLEDYPTKLALGASVEFGGYTSVGSFGNFITGSDFQITGKGELPEPVAGSAEALLSGRLQSQ